MPTLLRLFWNPDQRRLRALWRLLLHLLLVVIVSAGAGLLLSFVYPVEALLTGDGATQSSSEAFLGVGLGAIGVIGGTVLAARLLDRRRIRALGLHLDRTWWLDLCFGLALGALLMALIFAVELAAGWVTVTGLLQTAGGTPFALAILGPLVVFLLVGFYEELFSRGYHLINLAEGLNLPAVGPRSALLLAWLISSAIFGVLHAANPNATFISTLNIVLAGLFLGLGMVLSGELAIPIGIHITWNFFQGNVFGFPVSGNQPGQTTFIAIEQQGPELWTGGAFGPEAGLLGVFAMLLGFLLTWLWLGRRGRPRLQLSLAEYGREGPERELALEEPAPLPSPERKLP